MTLSNAGRGEAESSLDRADVRQLRLLAAHLVDGFLALVRREAIEFGSALLGADADTIDWRLFLNSITPRRAMDPDQFEPHRLLLELVGQELAEALSASSVNADLTAAGGDFPMPTEPPQSGAPLVLEIDEARVAALLLDSDQTATLLASFDRQSNPAGQNPSNT